MTDHSKTGSERPGTRRAPSGRRKFLRDSAATAALAAAAPGLLFSKSALPAARAVKIGFIGPRTGALARFGESNDFILAGIRKVLANGLPIAGSTHPVEIIEKDSRSDPQHASDMALELIKSNHIDLLVASSTGATVNPVSDQCEKNGVPCITTDAPWQSYFFGRGGAPEKGFDWTYHFFWGLEDLIGVFTAMWNSLPTNKIVGALWPSDPEGLAYSDPKFGFPPALQSKGFTLVDPGRFDNSVPDYSEQIAAFKKAHVEILSGVLPPPAFAAFWKQAGEQNFHPEIATVAKGLLFPSAVEALGARGAGLTTEVWWSPSFPFSSGLTGKNSAELCAAYEDETKRQWTQPLGYLHALFEVALDVLKRTTDIDSPASIRDSILATKYDSIVGRVSWTGKPVKNVCKMPLVGGQWILASQFKGGLAGQGFKHDLVIVNNEHDPSIGLQRKLEPLA
jgi:branched-chain amino acid transport system substrate-binding protein